MLVREPFMPVRPTWLRALGLVALAIGLSVFAWWPMLDLEFYFVLHAAAGFVCMWILARHELRLSREAAFVSSGCWAFSGAHALHFSGTGFQWAASLYIPLVVFLWRRAEKDVRFAVGLGMLLSLQFWGAGVYAIMLQSVMLVGETITRAWRPSRWKGILRALVVAGFVAFLLSAGRAIPVVYQMLSHKRQLGVETDALQWNTIRDIVLARNHSRGVVGQTYTWPEYGNYIGPLIFTLVVFGVVLGSLEFPWLLVAGVWTFLFMLGHSGKYAPWHLLKENVYPFTNMRVPSRFTVPVGMFLAAFAGIGVDRVGRLAFRISRRINIARAVRTAAFGLGLIGVGDLCVSTAIWIADSYYGAPIKKDVVVSPKLYLDGPGLAGFVDQPRQNRGRAECWDEWGWEREAALWAGDVPQAKPLDKKLAIVTDVTRTQNTFTADVEASKPTRVLFNSTYDLGWRTSVGEVVDNNELLGVDVPAGHWMVYVRYWPRGLTVGIVITWVGIFGVSAFFVIPGVRARRRRRKLDALAPLPPQVQV